MTCVFGNRIASVSNYADCKRAQWSTMKRVCNVLELCLLPCIVDHFQNEGKYKLWSFIKHLYEVYAVVYGPESTYRLS